MNSDSDQNDSGLSLARIQEYIWARYVDFARAPFPLDEVGALAFFARHYAVHPLTEDCECYYYGILAYEQSFTESPPKRSLLNTALRAFQAYRNQTAPDFRFSAVEDRYADALEALQIGQLP